MTDRQKLLALFARTRAHRFDTLRAWAESNPPGVPRRLAKFYADRPADSWWAQAFTAHKKEVARHAR